VTKLQTKNKLAPFYGPRCSITFATEKARRERTFTFVTCKSWYMESPWSKLHKVGRPQGWELITIITVFYSITQIRTGIVFLRSSSFSFIFRLGYPVCCSFYPNWLI